MAEPSQPDSQTTGTRLLLSAFALMLIASILGALIQTGYLPHNSTTETIGFISYLCVALPIIPGVIAIAGFILLAQSRK